MDFLPEGIAGKKQMLALADKYENADFIKNDPSQFMHRFSATEDIELVAFLAANLAFGRRDQIISHVQMILDKAGSWPAKWVLDGSYKTFFLESDKSFYRMFSFRTMRIFFDVLSSILKQSSSLGDFFHAEFLKACKDADSFSRKIARANSGCPLLSKVIASFFPKECSIIPHGESSADKRLQMFLRWMVRDSSPVDMGLWKWYKKTDLLIPLDTHVMQEATRLGFLPPASSGKCRAASLKTAVELTDKMRQYFPEDPVRADFALFGLGVDKA
ncbi:MAG: TIGR02757 family protein [Treponema sp.]|nr:TIGR02757 family protein [Treponema sp.]MBQ4024209.1 TIGR02757 family protein [Treponema sp.]